MDEDEHYRRTPPLRNRPVGEHNKDYGIDVVALKARQRLATNRKKVSERFNSKRKAVVFDVGSIVTVKIPKKERPTGIENRLMYARVLDIKRNLYRLQKKHGILLRRYHTRDLAPVAAALAYGLDLPRPQNDITLQQAAQRSTTASYLRISCRCKGSCDTMRCSCKKQGVRCSIHCHQGA